MAASVDQGYSGEDISFVKELPDHVEIECPVCLQVMLTDPHLVTCCGHHFCGPCIERVKDSYGPCPMCKEKNYQAFVDKNTLRIISGLQVYCPNMPDKQDDGCQWKGNLKNLSTHLNKGKREGECQYEKVKCRYEKCQVKKLRCYLDDHEKMDCPHRPYQCQYCGIAGYLAINKEHYEKCIKYPMSCPNKCQGDMMFPRSSLESHLSKECPLHSIECPFSWAGCTDKPFRKDIHSHTADFKHMSLLALACGKLNITCRNLAKENKGLDLTCDQLKKTIEELAETCTQLKKDNQMLAITCEKTKKGNEELALTCAQLEKENTGLSVTCTQLRKDNEKLTTICEQIKTGNKNLVTTCAQLNEDTSGLAVTCKQLNVAYGQLKRGNEELSHDLKKENKELFVKCIQLKKRNDDLALECSQVKGKNEKLGLQMRSVYSAVTDNYPILPITINQGSSSIHLYTHIFGHHISIMYDCGVVSLAFHEGKFDKLEHKVPKISVKFHRSQLLPIVTNIYKKIYMHYDVLITNRGAPGVLNVRLGLPQPSQVEILMSWT